MFVRLSPAEAAQLVNAGVNLAADAEFAAGFHEVTTARLQAWQAAVGPDSALASDLDRLIVTQTRLDRLMRQASRRRAA